MDIISRLATVPFLQSGAVDEATEVFIAIIVRMLVAAGLTIVPDHLKEKWQEWGWRNAILFVLSFLIVPMSAWLLRCVANVPIPGFDPRCDFTGVVLDCLYPGFMAFFVNYVADDVIERARSRKQTSKLRRAALAINNIWTWIFLITVAVEFTLLQSALDWQLSLTLSIVTAIVTTLIGLYLQRALTLQNGNVLPLTLEMRLDLILGDVLWWILLAVKIIVHILPLPFWLKPIVSIGMTILLFIFVNVIVFRRATQET
jgi:hypothetical protein